MFHIGAITQILPHLAGKTCLLGVGQRENKGLVHELRNLRIHHLSRWQGKEKVQALLVHLVKR